MDFEETFSCARQNFEKQSKVLEPSEIIISYYIIINA